MIRRPHRALVGLVALLQLAPLLAGPAMAADQETSRMERLARGTSKKIFAGLRRVLEGITTRASRSDRVHARVEMAFLDEKGRMFFDIQGSARVAVPGEAWRKRIRAAHAAGQSYTMASNGPVGVDLAATPLEVKGKEVHFAFQLDLTIDMQEIWAGLRRGAIGALGAVAASTLAGRVIEALGNFRVDLAGDAIQIGVGELSGILGGDVAAFAGYQGVSPTLRSLVPKGVTGPGLLRHFLVSILFAASSTGAQLVGVSLGSAVGAALLPGSAGLVAIVLTTAAAAWFGSWVVHTVAVRLPVLWKLKKLRRLHENARDQAGRDAAAAYAEKLAQRLVAETRRKSSRWTLFELYTQHLDKLRQAEGAEALEAYRPVTGTLIQTLQIQVMDGDWISARMYWQLKKALGELPEGTPPPEKPR